jgi:hypothetical protein
MLTVGVAAAAADDRYRRTDDESFVGVQLLVEHLGGKVIWVEEWEGEAEAEEQLLCYCGELEVCFWTSVVFFPRVCHNV